MEYIITDKILDDVEREVSRLAASAVAEDGTQLYDGIAITSRDEDTLRLMADDALSTLLIRMGRYAYSLPCWYRWEGENTVVYYTVSAEPETGDKVYSASGEEVGEITKLVVPNEETTYEVTASSFAVKLGTSSKACLWKWQVGVSEYYYTYEQNPADGSNFYNLDGSVAGVVVKVTPPTGSAVYYISLPTSAPKKIHQSTTSARYKWRGADNNFYYTVNEEPDNDDNALSNADVCIGHMVVKESNPDATTYYAVNRNGDAESIGNSYDAVWHRWSNSDTGNIFFTADAEPADGKPVYGPSGNAIGAVYIERPAGVQTVYYYVVYGQGGIELMGTSQSELVTWYKWHGRTSGKLYLTSTATLSTGNNIFNGNENVECTAYKNTIVAPSNKYNVAKQDSAAEGFADMTVWGEWTGEIGGGYQRFYTKGRLPADGTPAYDSNGTAVGSVMINNGEYYIVLGAGGLVPLGASANGVKYKWGGSTTGTQYFTTVPVLTNGTSMYDVYGVTKIGEAYTTIDGYGVVADSSKMVTLGSSYVIVRYKWEDADGVSCYVYSAIPSDGTDIYDADDNGLGTYKRVMLESFLVPNANLKSMLGEPVAVKYVWETAEDGKLYYTNSKNPPQNTTVFNSNGDSVGKIMVVVPGRGGSNIYYVVMEEETTNVGTSYVGTSVDRKEYYRNGVVFYLPDVDKYAEKGTKEEITRFMVMSVTTAWLRERYPSRAEEYATRAISALENAVSMLMTRKLRKSRL